MKKTFIFYADWLDYVDVMTLEEKGLFLETLLRYQTGKELGDVSPIRLVRARVKKQIDEDNLKREAEVKKRSDAGKKGGKNRRKQAKQASAGIGLNMTEFDGQKQTKQADNVNDNDNILFNRNIIFTKEYIDKYGKNMLEEFYKYWTEKNLKTGKKRREDQKYFEIPKRLTTWFKKSKEFSDNKSNLGKKQPKNNLEDNRTGYDNGENLGIGSG